MPAEDERFRPGNLLIKEKESGKGLSVEFEPNFKTYLDAISEQGFINLRLDHTGRLIPVNILNGKVDIKKFGRAPDRFFWNFVKPKLASGQTELRILVRGMYPALVPEKVLGNGMENEYKNVVFGIHHLFLDIVQSAPTRSKFK